MTTQSLYTIICYSHTDFLDILNVQNSYLHQYPEEKILLINENNIQHTPEYINATSCFQQILYYNDSLNYSKKIYNTLCNINIKNKHIIFLHDNDILIQKKQENIVKIIHLMNEHNIHRVDFQNGYHRCDIFDDIIPVYDNASLRKTLNDNYYYNVNPSIWELKCFLELMNNINLQYCLMEGKETQLFCKSKYNIYRLYDETNVIFAYYKSTDTFTTIHITCGRILVNPYSKVCHMGEDYNFSEKYINEYVKILNTFTLNSKREMHTIQRYGFDG
jgi:hypothetical protein